ncbi:MAG: protein-L-isoaspartate O-methyltransferase [Betaproteobacteria bacterium]|jgi:protein-L-isoaspartate(D-aspartate) O-methyltransferase|nr:protein-L-isoaspartate O-methyltransferase [Betaproteobacteria bacterium]HMV21718.1 protein-L-isoaspartate O-methyltransferase [Rhodocyclaceae bacterium]HMW77719.1 protein-L-isoaspartate O-methyltransferase [Rhodocyclaceae bacterium]HNE44010.1 protein-L-isoaspartate O-methyltransferase [Rhodocyclaceae bacterium]HNL22341.1 protein-L-isoaspartate O-methyltransferase [Rhodocyclaceae bacterium]
MNIEQARFNMIEQQIRPWEVLDPTVLDLLFVVKREDFVPEAYRALAFADMEIPIGQGQAMLAPKIEARLLQELGVRKTDKILEIGSGSGYMAALLAARGEHVVTVEINPELADGARRNLERAGVTNVAVETGDGAQGWSHRGPYDVIVVSGALAEIPETLLKQLRVGGRLAAIVGEAPVMEAQLVTCTAPGVYNTVNLFETVAPLLKAPAKSGFAF